MEATTAVAVAITAVVTWVNSLNIPNNNWGNASKFAFSQFSVNSESAISLLGKINLSVLSTKSFGYNLRMIGFTQSFTKLYRLCFIKYRFYLL